MALSDNTLKTLKRHSAKSSLIISPRPRRIQKSLGERSNSTISDNTFEISIKPSFSGRYLKNRNAAKTPSNRRATFFFVETLSG